MKLSEMLEEASRSLLFGKHYYYDGKAYCTIGAFARELGYPDTELAREHVNWEAFTREMCEIGVLLPEDEDAAHLLWTDIIEYNDTEASGFADVSAWLREKGY